MFDYVIYHSPCSDGFTGAFCVWLVNPNAKFIGLEAGNPFPRHIIADFEGKKVIMIDVAFDRDIMIEIHKVATQFVILDHHETNQQRLKDLEFAHFDMTKSGCMLAWEFMFPNEPMPDFIRYIGLRDLWKHQDDSKALYFTSGMPYTDSFEELERYLNPFVVEETIDKGEIRHEYKMEIAKEIARWAVSCRWQNHSVLIVNCPWLLVSDVGHYLYTLNPECVIILWSKQLDKLYNYSFRSNTEKGPNVAELAKTLGGGGHRNAAGAKSQLSPEELIKQN